MAASPPIAPTKRPAPPEPARQPAPIARAEAKPTPRPTAPTAPTKTDRPKPRPSDAEPASKKSLWVGGVCVLALVVIATYWFFFSGPGATIRGTVSFENAPVPMGELTFIAADNTRVTVNTESDGSYIARSVPFGEVKVTIRQLPVQWKDRDKMSTDEWKAFRAVWEPKQFSMLPPQYAQPKTTPFRYRVESRWSSYDIRLQK